MSLQQWFSNFSVGAEPTGSIPVALGRSAHMYAQENQTVLLIKAVVQIRVEPLYCNEGTLGFQIEFTKFSSWIFFDEYLIYIKFSSKNFA